MLIDGGASPGMLSEKLSQRLSLTNKRIDAVIASQQTAQLITGFSQLNRVLRFFLQRHCVQIGYCRGQHRTRLPLEVQSACPVQ